MNVSRQQLSAEHLFIYTELIHEACLRNVLLRYVCMHHLGMKGKNTKTAVKLVKWSPMLTNLNCSKLFVQYTKLLFIILVIAHLFFPFCLPGCNILTGD